MRVFITDLAAYNQGHLIGEWVELPSEDINADIARVLTNGALACESGEIHEEYFVTDYEGFPFAVSEHVDLEELNQQAEDLNNYDDEQLTAIELMIDNGLVCDLDGAIEHLDDMRNTNESSMEDVAIEYVDSCGLLDNMPENLRYYFDYESLGRDMEIEGSYFTDGDNNIWEFAA